MLNEFSRECVQTMITYLYTGKLDLPTQLSAVADLAKLIELYGLSDEIAEKINLRIIELQRQESEQIALVNKCPLPWFHQAGETDASFRDPIQLLTAREEVPHATPVASPVMACQTRETGLSPSFKNPRQLDSTKETVAVSNSIMPNGATEISPGVIPVQIESVGKGTNDIQGDQINLRKVVCVTNQLVKMHHKITDTGNSDCALRSSLVNFLPKTNVTPERKTTYITNSGLISQFGLAPSSQRKENPTNAVHNAPIPSSLNRGLHVIKRRPHDSHDNVTGTGTGDNKHEPHLVNISPEIGATEEDTSIKEMNSFDNDQHEFVLDKEIKKEPGITENECNMEIETSVKEEPNIVIKEENDDIKNGETVVQKEENKTKKDQGRILEIEDKTSKRVQYFCSVCFLHFKTKSMIISHLRVSHKLTQCKICEDGLYRSVGKKGKKKQVVFQCAACHKCWKSEQSLYKHTKLHKRHLRYYKLLTNQDKLTCKECNKLFPSEAILKRHSVVHVKGYTSNEKQGYTSTEKPRVPCEICGQILSFYSIKVITTFCFPIFLVTISNISKNHRLTF